MDSEVARLMPNNMQDKGLQDASLNTSEIRKYVQVSWYYYIDKECAAAFLFAGHSNRQLGIHQFAGPIGAR